MNIVIIANTGFGEDVDLGCQVKEESIFRNSAVRNGRDVFLWMGKMNKTDFTQGYLDARDKNGSLYLFWNQYSDIYHFFACLDDNVHVKDVLCCITHLFYTEKHERIDLDLKHRCNLLKKKGIVIRQMSHVDISSCICPFDIDVFDSSTLNSLIP